MESPLVESVSNTTVYAFIAVSVLVLYFIYSFWYAPFQLWRRYGIPGPTPQFFYGNEREIEAKGIVTFHEEMIAKYGPVVGYYIGCAPYLLVSDLDMLKQIMVRDFDKFINRPTAFVMKVLSPIADKGLLASENEPWRRSRRILTPTFSSAKLKVMVPIMEGSVDHIMNRFTASCDTGLSVNVYKWFGDYTMNVLLATSLGVSQDDMGEHTTLVAAAANVFTAQHGGNFLNPLSLKAILSNLPWIVPVVKFLIRQSNYGLSWRLLEATAKKLISERRSKSKGNNSGKKDFLQLMLLAREDETDFTKIPHNYNRNITKGLYDREIVAHITHFFLAGYETTSNCLGYTAYLLALNPDTQDTLYQEIEQYYQENPSASMYEACEGVQYLDMVLRESLRIYSPVHRTARVAKETIKVKDTIIPKGACVEVPLDCINRDPELWPEPDRFLPERFLPGEKVDRHPCAFMSFSVGPRNCIGMRFALLEAKMLLLPLVRQMKFVTCKDTEIPLARSHGLTCSPKNGVYLLLESR